MKPGEAKASWWSKVGIDPGRYVGRDSSAAEATVRAGLLAKTRRHLGKFPMAREAVALYFCMLDPATPAWVKAVVAAALAYFVLPLDAVPDLLPFVGLSDDASLLAAAYASASNFVTADHREQARAWIDREQAR